jgi:hypothetical protein
MRQIRVAKRRPGPASWSQTPLPPDLRDPDMVRAHQVTRSAGHPRSRTNPDHARRRRDLLGSPRPSA